MKRPPKNFIIQIQDSFLAEFLYHWVQNDKPCSLLIQKPNTETLTAIKLVVDSDETAEFVQNVQLSTGCKLFDVTPQEKQ